ncbi:hypothetical protein MTsPCn9_16600 [Croceitalea sp. MTPC9]|uniref:hypothetical protein n=1 Tax=unclassified Croceitalea TaxID=2632280 RepID=UPI002B3E0E40|nr:hypothetical protein MTsPCn6_09450 [Croceitalea sp. MTPC6]GMN16724.1 hypothetical protein MTsPCn9_16600 [Croceitalea sp. MTPC9]
MLKNSVAILLVSLVVNYTYGQSVAESRDSNMYSYIGKEGVFIHYNAPLLFVGEYLYYSVYCLNKRTGTTSNISKIAYVELIGEDKSVVFRQKIALEDGSGQGDFFIPVSVPSGNYKLVGYTQWMLNWGEKYFFQDDISILNPYTNSQKPFLSDFETDSTATNIESINFKGESGRELVSTGNKNKLELSLVKDTLSKREKATMLLRSRDGESSLGSFSISVRKYDSLHNFERTTSLSFKKTLTLAHAGLSSTNMVLPEMRGNLFSGTIYTDNPILKLNNQKVLFSLPGEEYLLKVLNTNEKGNFSFSLNKEYTSDTALFQILGNERENYTIELNEEVRPDYSFFTFEKFKLNPKMKKMILERSVHNQIENAYFSAKPDTIGTAKKEIPFYGKDVIVYNLDDYTRFSTFKETLVEIIGEIGIFKDKTGKSALFLKSRNFTPNKIGYLPLVIVDGQILQDFEKLIQYDARKIKSISIKKDLYIIGGHIFQGIIDVKTLESNYQIVNAPYLKKVTMLKPLERKKYFKQVYVPENEPGLKKIPDYRHQLLWMPKVKLDNIKESIDFFASDVPGNYEISLEGFTFSGNPVSIKKIFLVE